MKVAFYTLGCRLNFAESSDLARRAQELGHEVVEFEAPDAPPADLYVVNTCTVTAAAEKKCRQIIHQAHRLNPAAKIAVVGCFSELRPDEVKALAGVDIVLGTHNKHLLFASLLDVVAADLPSAATAVATADLPSAATTATSNIFIPSYSTVGRTRSFFKVQDGCNNFCSYCAIPYARGRSRSDTVSRTIETARTIAAQGVKEIVLTGVNIGDFGRENGENLYGLLRELDKLETVSRIRIGSVEPDLLSDEIIDLMAASNRLMPHFHIPLQAGHNDVLKKMRRHYTREDYAERVQTIRRKIPHAFIACDLIVGFPTETARQFDDACAFIENLDLSALHVFSYSDRAEALASRIPPVYRPGEKAQRSARMHALSDRKKEAFYSRFAHTLQTVLWESDIQDGKMFGYTPNYLRVSCAEDPSLVNTLQQVRLGGPYKDANKDWCLSC